MKRAGDVCLYFTKSSLTDWLIGLRTWSNVAHVEIYAGGSLSWASRNGIGVNRYPFRRAGLSHVLRPNLPFSVPDACQFFATVWGTKYGWLDLLQFFSLHFQTRGLICSQFGDLLLQSAGVKTMTPGPSRHGIS